MVNHQGTSQFEALHRLQDDAVTRSRAVSPPQYSGEGIVMVAGGGKHFVNAFVTLSLLRHDLRCALPIQLWHLGAHEMTTEMLRLLERFDVEIVDASEVLKVHPMRTFGGWQCKPYAILHSPFEKVILIDADNFALHDPALLFETPELRTTGALFWPDIASTPRHSPVWDLFRVPYQLEPEFESGQIVIDKSRAWEQLNLAVHYCDWSDVYWQYVNGDKQTFQMAWRFLERPYALCPWPAAEREGAIITPAGPRKWTVALDQHDFTGRHFFHHRVASEWVLYGHNYTIESAGQIEARCLAILDELRKEWDGRIAVDHPVRAVEADQGIFSGGRFLYRRVGIEERELELLADGQIGVGRAANEISWKVTVNSGNKVLTISRPDADISRLKLDHDGVWRGHWLYYEQNPVELVPLDSGTSDS